MTEATERLCEDLNPKNIIRTLLSKGDLDDRDVEGIKSYSKTDDRVEELLNILKRKASLRWFRHFMTALKKESTELYNEVNQIEKRVIAEGIANMTLTVLPHLFPHVNVKK